MTTARKGFWGFLFLFMLYFASEARLKAIVADNYILLNNSQSGLCFLSFNLNGNFLTASQQQVSHKYNLGSFKFKVKNVSVFEQPHEIVIDSSSVKISVKGKLKNKSGKSISFLLEFYSEENNELQWRIEVADENINHFSFTFGSSENEQIFGMGEQFSQVNLKGKKVPVWVEEQGIGRGDAPITFFANLAMAGGHEFSTYAPLPFFITSANKGFLLNHAAYSEFDFSNKKNISISCRNNKAEGYVWIGNEPKEILTKHTAITGRMPQLPDWAFGSWLGLQGGKEKVQHIVHDALNAGNPVTAVWIQDWVGKRQTRIGSRLFWNWLPDENSYPAIQNFIQSMNEKDIKVLGYINPFLAEYGPMSDEARAKNYLVKDKTGNDYKIAAGGFDAYMLDLTNPETRLWIKDIIKTQLIGNGFSGWMADFSEWLPLDCQLHSGIAPEIFHNQYPVEWIKLNREAIQEMNKEGEIIFFNRAGFLNSAQYSTLFWAGDQMVSWQKHDGMPSALNALLSSGFSGITLNHSDIGGYTGVNKFPVKYIRSRKLLYRWAEMNVWSPVFRTHEGLLPKKNFQFYSDSAAHAFFARMGKIHFALKDYLIMLNHDASEKGYPVVRHSFLVHPDDEKTTHTHQQFFLGDDILVMPVLKKRSSRVKGYLPKGEWEHIWSGEVFSGQEAIKMKAALGYPVVFLNKNGKHYNKLKEVLAEFR